MDEVAVGTSDVFRGPPSGNFKCRCPGARCEKAPAEPAQDPFPFIRQMLDYDDGDDDQRQLEAKAEQEHTTLSWSTFKTLYRCLAK